MLKVVDSNQTNPQWKSTHSPYSAFNVIFRIWASRLFASSIHLYVLHIHDSSCTLTLLAPIRFTAFFFPLRTPILVPGLHVAFTETQIGCELTAVNLAEVLLLIKLFLQLLELLAGKSSSLFLLSASAFARSVDGTRQWRVVSFDCLPQSDVGRRWRRERIGQYTRVPACSYAQRDSSAHCGGTTWLNRGGRREGESWRVCHQGGQEERRAERWWRWTGKGR